MNFKKLSLALFLALALTGCSRMYFHNGGKMYVAQGEGEEWHHDGILRLVEFSAPVDLAARCENQNWEMVGVKRTFIQGLVGGITYGWYDPWNVEFSCHGAK